MEKRGWLLRVCAAGVILGATIQAHADLPAYTLMGTYTAPSGAWDVMGDGRLITIDGGDILVQDSLNGSAYNKVGSVPAGTVNGGASFLRLNPSGSTIAIGDNNFGPGSGASVYLVETSTLNPAIDSPTNPVLSANFDAQWADDDTLYVTGGDAFGAATWVTEIDASTVTSPTASIVIDNIGGASGGVTSDGTRLFTANGFDNGPGGSSTGTIRAFPLASLGGSPLDFDALGNMLVGGGDFSAGDTGYAGVIDSHALDDALTGGPTVPGSAVLRLTPGGSFDFYSVRANRATSEVLVTYFGDPNVYRYGIPAPGGAGLLATAAVFAARRRKRAA